MSTRMERYNSENFSEERVPSRVSRNNSLYQDIKNSELNTRVTNESNMRVIESNGKTIDIEKIKRYIEETNNEEHNGRKSVVLPTSNTEIKVKEEGTPKDYDLNSVLEKAKKSREVDYESERYKKLRDTQYDILSKIKMYEKENEDKVPSKEDFNTEERTLIDLINTVTIHKGDLNLLDELVGDGTDTTLPIEEEKENKSFTDQVKKSEEEVKEEPVIKQIDDKELEKEKEKEEKEKKNLEKTQELVNLKDKMDIDKSFYTNSMTFNKKDFEGLDELEKSVKKNSIFGTIIIIIIVIFIIITLVIMANYVFKLGLF